MIHGVRVFVPLMLAQDTECHVVNTASVAGLLSGPGLGAYKVTKHGVVTLSETLHHELAERGAKVKVSVLCPGWVATNIADSERNRPENLTLPVDADAVEGMVSMGDVLKDILAAGMQPDVLAGKVLDAIRAEQFWILTHDDVDDMWIAAANRRVDSIRNRSNPVGGFFL